MSFDPTLGLRYASRSNRLVGQILDGVVGLVPIFIVGLFDAAAGDSLAWLGLPAVLWMLFYYLFADGLSSGRSFAKQWLGMRVVDAHTGAPCSFFQSFLRNLLLAIGGPLDWVFIFGERHQRLGDKAAGTIVVQT